MNIFRLRITYLLFVILATSVNLYGQGTCLTAEPLTPGTSQCGDTSDGGDTFDDDVCLANYDGGDDYMFSYTVPSNENGFVMEISLSSNGSRTGIALIDACPIGGGGNCLGAAVGSGGSKSFISDPLTAGVTYYIHISTLPAPQNVAFCLDVIIGQQGCTNSLANNYNAAAVIDDNSCMFPIPSSSCGLYTSNPQDTIDNSLAIVEDSILLNVGMNEVLTDIDIVLDITHTSLSDLEVSLTSPTGTVVNLLNAHCNAFQDLNVRLDDDSNPLICNSPTVGFYQAPAGVLSDFNNELSDGYWVLKIIDNSGGDNGKLNSWCLIPQTLTANCFAPSNLDVNNISYTTATITWTSNNIPIEPLWDIEIVNQGLLPTGTATFTSVNTNPYVVTGLTPQTDYDYYVRANCGLTRSLWSGPFSFRTELSNPTPCGLGLSIPDNSCTANNEFLIDVNGEAGPIGTNVFLEEVRLIISHTWAGDLEIFLTAPDGTTVELSSDNGNNGNNYGDPLDASCTSYTAFSMNTCNSILDGSPPFIGLFRPEGNLYDFNGVSPNGTWTLKLCDDGVNDFGVLEFVELHFSNSVCSAPDNVVANNVGSTTVDLNWNTNGTCDTTIIEYGPVGFTPGIAQNSGGGTIVKVPCLVSQSYVLNNLQELTDYDIYLRANCGGNNYSPNSCVLTVATECATDPISIIDDFDNQTNCINNCGSTCSITGTWSNSAADDFDWIIDSGGTASSGTGPADDISSGGNYIYIEAGGNVCQSSNEAILNSNCIQIAANNGMCHMSFYYHLLGIDIGTLRLDISTDGGVNWSPIWSVTGAQGSNWEIAYVDLAAYDGTVTRFRFVSFGATGPRGDMALDEITFYGSTDLGQPANVFYADVDMDGFGNPNDSILSCFAMAPIGYLIDNTDCNDADPSINPNSTEVPCNQVDENCNGNLDDSILPSPSAITDEICIGTSSSLNLNSAPTGQYYWYDSPANGNIIATGNTLNTPTLFDTTTYYIQDSITAGEGLRITEVDLNFINGIEIQSLGTSRDYTGWVVAVSNDFFNINTSNSVTWSLGPMMANQVDYRTENINDNYFGASLLWFLAPYPPVTGWAMIIDDTGNVVDAVFWGWPEANIQNMNTLINGYNITGADLPWTGDGIDIGSCGFGTTINLFGSVEMDSELDYNPCSAANLGLANSGINFSLTCRSSRTPITVNVNPVPDLQILDTVEICSGSQLDLSIQGLVDVNNSGAVLSYHTALPATISNQLPSSLVTPNQSTEYYVQAITATGCSDIDSVFIKVFPQPNANIFVVGQTNLCPNTSSTLIATVAGGVGPYSYIWSTGTNTNTINVDANSISGTTDVYSITVTDTNGCNDTTSININTVNGVSMATIANITDVAICGGNDGSVTITPDNGLGPFSYAWDGPTTGSATMIPSTYTMTGLAQGSYRVTISDNSALNCELIIPVIVVNGPVATIQGFSSTDVSCNNDADGTISVNVSGTNPTYLWSNGDTTANITMLPADTYDLTITDGICTNELLGVIISEPPPLTAFVLNVNDPSCANSLDGEISISVIGGMAPYSILWNNGDTSAAITNLDEGSYTALITDANNCTFNLPSVELEDPSRINIIFDDLDDISCFGEQDGKIELTVTGGAPPYFYNWSNGALTEDLYNLDPGSYTLTVTDISGCTQISPLIIVREPTLLTLSIDSFADASCIGVDDGSVNTTMSGGVNPYFYDWDNGGTTDDLSGLSAGTYILTAMDANSCIVKDTVQINAPQLLSYSLDSIANATCYNDNDGFVAISSLGGTLPHSYSWNNGIMNDTIDNLAPGNYEAEITDAVGCKLNTPNIVITEPDSLKITVLTLEHISCFGLSDGSIDVLVEGGTPPYIYSWNNSTNNEDLSNVPVGTYKLTIQDANNCIKTSPSIVLNEPSEIVVQVDTVIDIGCIMGGTGAIDVSVIGGVTPYSYAWDNGGMTQDISNLLRGTYSLTVTDSIGCPAILSNILVSQLSNNVIVDTTLKKDISCFNERDGEIHINVLNATSPFQFNWSHGSIDSTATDLQAGMYDITITDVNGCVGISDSVEIKEPSLLTFTVLDINNSDCLSNPVGNIDIDVFGGTMPYSYQWSNGDTIQDPINLLPNDYFVTVTDVNGCSMTSLQAMTVETLANDLAIINVVIDEIDCYGNSNGAIDIIVSGGVFPYTYQWSNGDTIQDPINLASDSYMVTVTDQAGCTTVSSFPYVVQGPTSPLQITTSDVGGVKCFGDSTGVISILVEGGTAPYNIDWSNGDTTSLLMNLSAGFYSVDVEDALGCTLFTSMYQIGEPMGPLDVPSGNISIINNDSCLGGTGSISLLPVGGTAPYSFRWSNDDNGMTINNLVGGNYHCTVEDNNGCTYIVSDIFVDNPLIDFSISPVTTPESDENQDGTATVEVSGGTPPYTFLWDITTGNQVDSIATNLSNGTYALTITDADGCSQITSVLVDWVSNIDEIELIRNLDIFPNPTSSQLNLNVDFKESVDIKIKLFSLIGESIVSIDEDHIISKNYQLDLNNNPAGIYLLSIQINHEHQLTKRIILTK